MDGISQDARRFLRISVPGRQATRPDAVRCVDAILAAVGGRSMRWLPEPSRAAVVDALRVIAPALAGLPVTIPSPAGQDDPVFQMSSAALSDDFVVKFAWSQAAARFILHQITILETLALEPAVPYLPEVAAAGTSPLILVTRRVRGMSLFDAVDRIDRNHAGEQLARFLAALHSDQTRRRAEAAVGPIPAWYPLVTTAPL